MGGATSLTADPVRHTPAVPFGVMSSVRTEAVDSVFVEDWSAAYGSAYLIPGAEIESGSGQTVEDGEGRLERHLPRTPVDRSVAFVDGVRRGEASLFLKVGDTLVRGVAGAHGRGAVVVRPGERPEFDSCTVERLVLWGGGEAAPLPDVEGGWSWRPASIASDDPDGPLQELQRRMREAEGRLAEDLCGRGHLTIVDGPLNFVRSRDLPVVGYVKTHYRPLLPPHLHERVPELQAGERTSLIAARSDVYTSYLRLTEPSRAAGPWSGIVRLEVPSSSGLKAAVETIDSVAASLPRFAGVPHVDPRAPQNLQPIGALETHLRHLLGDIGLATRAVRSAVDRLHRALPDKARGESLP